MRLAPKPLDIKERDGFTGTDLFGYEDFGKQLAEFVESLEGPSVISLDGPWGSGKTVFARQWAGLLRKRGSAVIYFDAFAADSGEDPLFDIASQLFAGAKDKTDEGTRQAFVNKTVRVIKSLAPVGVGVALESATAGLIGQGVVQAFASALSENRRPGKNADEQVSGAFQRRIKGALERKEAISDFRKALETLADAMKKEALRNAEIADRADNAEEDKESSLPRPLVIIIDELDRCKPTYALSLLENIKHVLDADNVCFMLVTNAFQLEKVVESQYGVKDATAYLEKFFQTTFLLPKPETQTVNSLYIQYMFDDMFDKVPIREPFKLTRILEAVVSQVGISLRGVERVVTYVAWCKKCGLFRYNKHLRDLPDDDFQDVIVIVVVGVVRALNADLYSKFRKKESSFQELVEFLQPKSWPLDDFNKSESIDTLRRAFSPTDAEEMEESDSEDASLRELVAEACRWLDVVQDPRPGRGRLSGGGAGRSRLPRG